MSYSVPPPSRHISSTPISLSHASHILSTYIANSESHAHLHPDSSITPEGISFSSKGGPEGNVVMHNLRRIAAGMRGEYMAPEPTPEPEDHDNEDAGGPRFGKRKRRAALNDGWQDKAEYEREEGVVEVGEIAPRSNFVQEGCEEPEVRVTGGAREEGGRKKRKGEKEGKGGEVPSLEGMSEQDKKAAKKAAKKQKNLDRKRDRAKASQD